MNAPSDASVAQAQIVRNLPADIDEYAASVFGKFGFAEYHREQCRTAWNKLHRNGFRSPSPKFAEFFLAYEANFIAYCQSLHSVTDIAAQVLNVAFLGNSLSEETVSFESVKKKADRSPACDGALLQQLTAISNFDLYKQVMAFVNVIKHRRLLHSSYRFVSGPKTGYRRGIMIAAFKYKEQQISNLWTEDMLADYDIFKKEIVALLNLVPTRAARGCIDCGVT